MMLGYLLSAEGKRWRLPLFTSWKLIRTGSVPCDSFEGTCLWDGGPDTHLEEACRLILEENGARRFTGVVDEWEWSRGESGECLTLLARGMAALLLDNEAEGQDYQAVTAEDILNAHVRPYGVEVKQVGEMAVVPEFSAVSGDSEWEVLYRYAKYYCGVEPRFDVYGRLTLDGGEYGRLLRLTGEQGILELSRRDKRYGVYSEVLVRDRGTLSPQRVVNEEFAARGGACRKVMTMPGKSAYEAMRYSGEYQLRESYAQRFRATVTLSGSYACEPGDRVELALKDGGANGVWRVLETESVLDRQGARVTLTLGEC